MRGLLHSAGWQWAGWMLAGFGLLQLARRSIPPAVGVALALATWAAAAWLGRVPWPLAADRAFVPGARRRVVVRDAGALRAVAARAAPSSCSRCRGWLRKRLQAGPQTMASRVGYPGLVLMTGIGWLLLLDLSANGHFGNRYLALYHQGHLWLGMLILSVLVFLRQPLGRAARMVPVGAGRRGERDRLARLARDGRRPAARSSLLLLVGAVGSCWPTSAS